ncbi:phosphodiester glycosidase family protein, partial [Pseudomonas zeae]|uniref:phosphodiester glycosidase family protein n=1 Tax=Pseudomonas zeae TaxID=2745510 RepID=UPI003D000518
VSGTPWLVRDGQARSADDDASCANLCAQSHPRTAVGMDASGRQLIVLLAAGRRGPVKGLTLAQTAELMRELGAVQAFNLDGGGSSTLL